MKISVLTPCYNAAPFLPKAIQSVMAQDYADWEHIVVDGGSTDGTQELLKQHTHLIWVSEPDKGQSDAMNKAFARSSGDLILYLNADDWMEPGAFSAVIRAFEQYPEASMVVGDFYMITETGTHLIQPTYTFEGILRHYEKPFPYNPVSYFYKRSVQEAVGDFPLDNHYTMDYWFLLRALRKHKAIKVKQVLGTFDMHGETKTSGDDSATRIRANIEAFSQEVDPKIWQTYQREYKRYKGKVLIPRRLRKTAKDQVYKLFFSGRMSREQFETRRLRHWFFKPQDHD